MRKSQASARSVAPPAAVERGDGRNAQGLEPIDHALEGVAVLARHVLPRKAIGESTDVEA